MLNHQTLDQLRALHLDGMVAALQDQATTGVASDLAFEDRLALLVQRQIDWRDGKRLQRLLKAAKLKDAEVRVQLQADDGVNYGEVARAMAAIERAGITKLAVITAR